MYKKVSTDMDFAKRELEVLEFWQKEDVFEKTKARPEDAPNFTFYEGPPTANGRPHIGHVLTRVVKDIIPRYKSMKGYSVLRKAGWDTHGLPVELEIEKELGISGKKQIEEYGVEAFIEKCKQNVWRYREEWEKMSVRVGFWVDYEKPYVTYQNEYIESIWWALKTIYEKGLLYKGHKVLPYCGRCGTSLSSHEVAQGYKDLKEKSVIAQFKVKNANEYILAWTTTPWTLPSNVALCVNPDEDYIRAKFNDKVYILAKALAENIFDGEYEIVQTMLGRELEHMEYVPLFDFVEFDVKSHYIVCDGYVTLTDGTGIVHQAPAFGEDDNRVARKYGLPFVQLVNDRGEMTSETPWAGIFAKKADPQILKYMQERDLVFKILDTEHNYPHCWRCKTPLLYYARSAWFIEMSKMRESLLENNSAVNWMPENVKEGRFGHFLDNVIDWSLSRERYWGTPLPIWECGCGKRRAIGSVDELRKLSEQTLPDNLDLHKPTLDKISIKCDCGEKMKRVPEVIDCWFDSGAMPFAQFHYPFENKQLFESNFPADFISEGIDQTRGWFYTLMAISTVIFGKNPYKNVIVLGHMQDKHGHKMNKSEGNVVPWGIVDEYGADAVRWFFFSGGSLWLSTRFSEESLKEVSRKFLGTLWNTYAFYVLYANIDNIDPTKHKLKPQHPMDCWILSRLNTLIALTDERLSEYKITEAAREIAKFVDELSNWYVRSSRERFWASGMEEDKIAAFMTLYTVLVETAKLLAPFVPFVAEQIYQNLVPNFDASAAMSVHLCAYPKSDSSLIDVQLETNMQTTLDIVTLGRAARNAANIKNRQPLSAMLVESTKTLPEDFVRIIEEELNIKRVVFKSGLTEYISYKLKPQLKTLGPRYGKLLPKISSYLSQNGDTLYRQLGLNGSIAFEIDDTEIALSAEDVLIEAAQKEGYMGQEGNGHLVVLETALSAELLEEGLVRELISKIQTMRRDAGFEILDKINLSFSASADIISAIQNNIAFIKSEVLAEDIFPSAQNYQNWNINGEQVGIYIEKILATPLL